MNEITTPGKLLMRSAIPEEYHDLADNMDKGKVLDVLRRLAKEHPDRYIDTLQKIGDVSREAVTYGGGVSSIKLDDFTLSPELEKLRNKHKADVEKILQSSVLSDKQKNDAVIKYILPEMSKVQKMITEMDPSNSMVNQFRTGAKGNPAQLMQLLYGDMMVVDSKGDPIPIASLTSYGDGAGTKEYWAGSYGSRTGYSAVQFGTADSGYLGKLLTQAAHRVVVTEDDCGAVDTGLPVEGGNTDNIGTVLIRPVEGLEAGHVISAHDIKKLKGKTILIRSATTCQADHGVCAKCAGKQADRQFPSIGEAIGVTAARAIAEPTVQMALCLYESTEVRMADLSTKKIKDIKIGDYVLGADEDTRTYPVKVTNVFDNGLRDVYDTEYRYSTSTKKRLHLMSTLDHKALQMTHKSNCVGEKYNGIPRILPVGEKGSWIMAVQNSGAKVFGKKHEPFALLAGMLLGDGCYTKSVHGVYFSCADPLLIEDTEEYLSTLGLHYTLLKGHDNIYYRISSESLGGSRNEVNGRYEKNGYTNPASKWLYEQGMLHKGALEKRLPVDVCDWDEESLVGLISGLIVTDGSLFKGSTGNTHVNFASASKGLVEDVYKLLVYRFGIYPGDIHEGRVDQYRKNPMYSLTIAKQHALELFYDKFVLYGVKRIKAMEAKNTLKISKANLAFNRCRRLNQSYIGKLNTYDIEVASESHLFVLANGLIVSNSTKHSGGVAGQDDAKIKGFKAVEQFVNVPKSFAGGATLSTVAGVVSSVKKASQGGHYITVDGVQHYVDTELKVKVKAGETIEAGDMLSSGVPNPAEIVKYKGIGEGRRYFTDAYYKILNDNGAGTRRSNVEALARGLINRVKITDVEGFDGYYMDDIAPYDSIARDYKPRKGFAVKTPIGAVGSYLEEPKLHYTIGTKITKRVASNLKDSDIKHVMVHREKPLFEPIMPRVMDVTSTDPDWKVRLGGFNLKRSFLDAATKGSRSDAGGTSYIPAVIEGKSLYSNYTKDGS